MFLKEANFLRNLNSSVKLNKISYFYITEITVRSDCIEVTELNHKEHSFEYDSSALLKQLSDISKLNIDSVIFSVLNDDFYLDFYGENLNICIFNSAFITLYDANNLLFDGRKLPESLSKELSDLLYKEYPLLFTIAYQ